MAAGGIDVLRRKESRFSRNGSRVINGASRYDDSGSRQNRFHNRTDNRKLEREESRLEDEKVQFPSEKKRKFSPVVWDEKDVIMSSKKRVTAITPSSDMDVSKASVFQPENLGSVSDKSVLTSQSSETESLPEREGVSQGQTREEIREEDGGFQGRTISMSRWASDDDSPQHMSDGECSPVTRRQSSPESGEFQREGSSSDRERVSCSESESHYRENELSDVEIEEPSVSTQQRVNATQSCRNVFEYERLNKINEGTYGVVYKARDKKTGEIVALKKVKMDVNRDDGFPLTSLREINILSSFSHPSVVEVKEVAMDDFDGVYMVMEYLEHDLKGLMEKMKERFSIGDVKWLMMQLLEGVKYLHDNWVLHRDLKTSNLLLSKEGRLKICDFGLSRQYGSPLKPYTSLVVTLWYRAPELLLGTKEYSTAIDMWSVGCIMAEFVSKAALFRGKTEVEQLDKIFSTLGTPNDAIWPGLSKLPGAKANFAKKPYKYNTLRKKFPPTSFTGSPALSDLGFDLLSRLLTYDPKQRITAEEALNHKWFVEAPLPRTEFKPSLPSVASHNRYLGDRQCEFLLQPSLFN